MKKIKSFLHYYIVLRRKIIRPILLNKKLSYFIYKNFHKAYLAMFYENWTGKILNYKKPEDLNQALIKLSILNSTDKKMRNLIPMCVDKYAVREYIRSCGYEESLNELYGVYDNVEDIDFSLLPSQFVMKMNNGCGRNYICIDKSKCDWEEIKKTFAVWLNEKNIGWDTGEWQYALIKPKIIIEKYLKDLGDSALIDYKAHVYNGKVMSFLVCYNRNIKENSVCLDDYDKNWNLTENILSSWHIDRLNIPKPIQLDKMIKMAEDCSKGFKYCRFDMYEIEGKVVFGEMTFTPHGNVLDYYTEDYLTKMKDLILI